MSAFGDRQAPKSELPVNGSRPRLGRDIGWALAIKLVLLITLAQLFFTSADKPRMSPDAVAGRLLSPSDESQR
jgi:hypothetical protein